MKKLNFKNKKALSEMVSYVLLISIGLALAILVFAWARDISNVEPITSCSEGTSIIIEKGDCEGTQMNLTIKNNGNFNVSGFIVRKSNNTQIYPIEPLSPNYPSEDERETLSPAGTGRYFFELDSPLKPGESRNASFLSVFVKRISIQPFIYDSKNNKIVICGDSDFVQEITICPPNH